MRFSFLLRLAVVLTASLACAVPARAQSSGQTTTTSSGITGDFNNVIQIPNQNNAQSNSSNSNINNPIFNNIYPLNTPANAEDDFSFNMSVGFSDDVTVSVGLLYQPGRTRAHQARMRHLSEQTDLLTTQKEIAEAELQLLQVQIQAAEQQLQSISPVAVSVGVSDDSIDY